MAILNSLYPPVVPDTMPAFIYDKICPISFSISIYNSAGDINDECIQISIVDLETNISALDPKKYPSGIKITSLEYIDNLYGYNYAVNIAPQDLKGGVFKLNTFYKVQLRFTKKGISKPKQNQQSSWFGEHLSDFSEWSKVCIVRGISSPELNLNGFSEVKGETSEIMLSNPLVDIIGKLTFKDSSETEYLKNYTVKILDGENEQLLFNSGDIYPIAKNEFNYVLPYSLTDGDVYFLEISYITNNSYQNTKRFKFIVIEYYGTDSLNASISAVPDLESGTIKINITPKRHSNKSLRNTVIPTVMSVLSHVLP